MSVPSRFAEEAEAAAEMLARPAVVPMACADACLVRRADPQLAGAAPTPDRDLTLCREDRRRVMPSITPEVHDQAQGPG